jgi:hypothetical protein
MGTSGIGCRRALFTEGTNFAAKDALAKKTPTKDTSAKVNDCVVKVKLKILHGVNNIQELVLGMMDHCLTILHKHDTRACFLDKKKSLKAYKATDFPRDFTNFYNNWGKWDEMVRAFLNTIPADKSGSFMGSFYFRCKWDPAQLFKKILLKMVSQKKHKETIAIELKPCQHLDTLRDTIFFNLPFCSDKGLCGTLRKAMTKQKSPSSNNTHLSTPRWNGARLSQTLLWFATLLGILHGATVRRKLQSQPITRLPGKWNAHC